MRLLCEYLHTSYEDHFLDPLQWKNIKEEETYLWIFRELPFIKHGDFVLTGVRSMIQYIVELHERNDLLGKTLEHKVKIDSFWSTSIEESVISLLCSKRPSNKNYKYAKKEMRKNTEKKILHWMRVYEKESVEDEFYFGYLTIVDFFLF